MFRKTVEARVYVGDGTRSMGSTRGGRAGGAPDTANVGYAPGLAVRHTGLCAAPWARAMRWNLRKGISGTSERVYSAGLLAARTESPVWKECAMHIDPLRPATKAGSRNRRDWRYYGLALGVLCMLAEPARAQSCTENPSCQPKFNFNGYDKGAKTVINNCTTNSSPSPCAWADAVKASTDAQAATYFLACNLDNTGPIALCYYSGVPRSPFFTPSCTFSQAKNAAECDCYQISSNTPNAGSYSYVLMTGILNKEVYEDTVNNCVDPTDGSITCLNLSDLQSGLKEAPVCDAIRNKTLFPGADLISDFSQIPIPNIATAGFPPPGEKDSFMQTCPTPSGGANLYAGCMTAPCKTTGKIDENTGFPIVKCTCPTYDGPNQVGNPQIESYSCSPTPHVWSSSYTDIIPN